MNLLLESKRKNPGLGLFANAKVMNEVDIMSSQGRVSYRIVSLDGTESKGADIYWLPEEWAILARTKGAIPASWILLDALKIIPRARHTLQERTKLPR